MATINFDWDDVDISDKIVISALDELKSRYGYGTVWYRISSSETGLHVVIAQLSYNNSEGIMELNPITVTNEVQNQLRQEFAEKPWHLECKGRLISDSVRIEHGYRTGRLFWAKNNKESKGWELYD